MTIVLVGRNVNDLYTGGVKLLRESGLQEKSRAGSVMVMPSPVMSIYERPTERVLFDLGRDANPFFHLFESLWMLSGCEDADQLNHYVKDFGARFAEKDGTIHGAYGYRWRHQFGIDQLDTIVERLRTNPSDRQCVLQMWDADSCDDLRQDWKDRPCNTHAFFRIREEPDTRGGDLVIDKKLDLTVLCRSNDIIWGAYGANAVHFSMLLEYMAGRIGVEVGRMYQFSNNYHAYLPILDKVGEPVTIEYENNVMPMPIGNVWNKWDRDLEAFIEWHRWLWEQDDASEDLDLPDDNIRNLWFRVVAAPMCIINWLWKKGRYADARGYTQHVEADDWREAASLWMNRRPNAA